MSDLDVEPEAPPAATVERWCFDLIRADELDAKLGPTPPPDLAADEAWEVNPPVRSALRPSRPAPLVVCERSPRTPRPGALARREVRAGLIHTLLHHELQAAELFAWGLLAFPEAPRAFRAGLVRLALEELRHLRLYAGHLRELGGEIGAHPVRDWFWQRVSTCASPLEFVALVGLGLEGANLEHSARLAAQFRAAGDEAGARVLEVVERDEVAPRRLRQALVRTPQRRAPRLRSLARRPAPPPVAGGAARQAAQRGRAPPRRARRRLPRTPRRRASRRRPRVSARPRLWVLNLDAEYELEAGRRYAPTRHVRALVERERERLLGTLVAPGDAVLTGAELDSQALARAYPEHVGVAWSPTPRALRSLARAGAHVDSPDVETLRRVNARPFAAAVRAPLVGASFAKVVAHALDEVLALVARPASSGWLVRRTFGAAGRARRRLHAGRPTADEGAWLAAGLRRGPLLVEPWVEVTREYTRSGWVHRDGRVIVAPPCFQETTSEGAWIRTALAAPDEVTRDDDERLGAAAQAAGDALATAGYFGPFGIDAFRHRLEGRRGDVLNPMSEINARFTMDWAESLGERADALLSSAPTATPRP